MSSTTLVVWLSAYFPPNYTLYLPECVFFLCSPVTPPGTKVRLKGNVKVVNGFLLLTRATVEVLGGQAESLLKKWTLNKVTNGATYVYTVFTFSFQGMADISRNRTGTTNGPPPFVPLINYRGKSTKDELPARKQTVEVKAPKPSQQSQQEPEKPTRMQMDKPKERLQRKPDRKPEASSANRPPSNMAARGQRQGRGRQREEDDDDDYQPSSRPQADCQLADWFGPKLNLSDKTSDRVAHNPMVEQRDMTTRTTEYSNPRRDDFSGNRRKPDRKHEASSANRPPSNMAARGRRQGRGRQREEDDDDDYQPSSRPQADGQLADWFGQILNLSDKTSDRVAHNPMVEQRDMTTRTTEYSNPRRDDFSGNSRGHGGRRGRDRYQPPRTDLFEQSTQPPISKSSHRQPKSEDTVKKFDKRPFKSKQETHKEVRTESKEPQRHTIHNRTDRTGHKQSHSQYESSRRKEEAPVVREVWTQPASTTSENHWDWVGSVTAAVPFSAKRQN